MKFSDVIGMAFRDLGKRKGRTFLTSLAVAIGSMLVLTMVGIGSTAENMFLDNLKKYNKVNQITVLNEKYIDLNEEKEESNIEEDYSEIMEKNHKTISEGTVKKISNINGVADLEAKINTLATSFKIGDKENKRAVPVSGYDLNYKVFANDEIDSVREKKNDKNINPIIAGRNLNTSDKAGILVGEKFLKDIGIKDYKSIVGKEVVLYATKATENDLKLRSDLQLRPLEVKAQVVGVVDEKFGEKSSGILASAELASTLKGYESFDKDYLKSTGYDQVVVHAKSADCVSSISKEIKNIGYQYFSFEQIAEQIKDFFTIGKQVLAVLGIIVLFVAAVGIVNTMTMSINEKTKYIGIMKSLGASRGNIHNMFLTQSGAIGFIGGLMGLGFSFVNGKIIEVVLKMYLQSHGSKDVVVNFTMPSGLILGTLVFAILMALAAGVYPSRKASKLDPVEALNS